MHPSFNLLCYVCQHQGNSCSSPKILCTGVRYVLCNNRYIQGVSNQICFDSSNLTRAHGLKIAVSEITLVSATCNLSSLIDVVVLFLISSSSYYMFCKSFSCTKQDFALLIAFWVFFFSHSANMSAAKFYSAWVLFFMKPRFIPQYID